MRKKPAMMLAMANAGVDSGVPRNPATVAQSRPKAPTPRPYTPDPICCAVTERLQTRHATETVEMVGNR
uniref:Uncharacterized protein n=1 Tax=Zea mays TaxID=4577 RepID=C4J6I6_MAIZE|nr:unknown [Zea mays]